MSDKREVRPIDVISRSAVLDRLEMFRRNYALKAGYRDAMTDAIGEVRDALTIDAVPVMHAMWIEDGYRGIPCVCSYCGEEAHYTSTFREQFDYDWEENLVPCGYEEIRKYIRSNRCPNCGAKMDGGKDDENA